MSEFTRRSFIGKTAIAIGSFAALQKVAGAEVAPSDRSKSDPGPANPMLDGQNPDSIWPPATDSKEPGAKLQVSVLFCEQTHLRGWMVTRSDCAGAARVQDPGRGQHETYCGWIPRAALAHSQRMGHHALRVQHGLRRSTWTAKVSSPT